MPRPVVQLPGPPFLYTLDQIQTLLNVTTPSFKKSVHYDGRTPGIHNFDTIMARNIAPDGEKPDWRVADTELKRWLRKKGFRIYDQAWLRS